jgi:hypothetical protein
MTHALLTQMNDGLQAGVQPPVGQSHAPYPEPSATQVCVLAGPELHAHDRLDPAAQTRPGPPSVPPSAGAPHSQAP